MPTSDGKFWMVLDVNPEPWAVGPVGSARRNGKMTAYVGRNQQLAAYQEAVREELTGAWGTLPPVEGKVGLRFYFWRNRAEYTTPQARTHRKHEADTTNLQKATEDALQGILFGNDRDVADIHSYMMGQGPDIKGRIVVAFWKITQNHLRATNDEIPDSVTSMLHALDHAHNIDLTSQAYGDNEEIF